METPKISVILPIYKVEPYLRKCLDSVVGQTYRNLEIILVDDGSPDSCGAICDEYAARDGRIRVIHKENGGLAAARNTGLAAATGEWIGWVDSDDWIELDMYEYLITNALESGADIAVCGRFEDYPDHTEKFFGWPEQCLLDPEQALEKLWGDDVLEAYMWDKLYRRELYQGIRFPEGYVPEDIWVMWKLFSKAERIVCLPEAKYHYLQRQDSISKSRSLFYQLDWLMGTREPFCEVEKHWPRLRPVLVARLALVALLTWQVCSAAPKAERRACLPELREAAEYHRVYYQEMRAATRYGLAGRVMLRMTTHAAWWSFAVYRLVDRLYWVKHGISD